MVKSLRYWLEVTDVIRLENKGHKTTEFGEAILNNDPGGTAKITKGLLHYHLTSDKFKSQAPGFNYFVYNFDEELFTQETLVSGLIKTFPMVSENTIKRDSNCILSLYTRNIRNNPEDKNVSILGDFPFVRFLGNNTYEKVRNGSNQINKNLIYFAIRSSTDELVINIDDLTNGKNSPLKTFNISKASLFEIIEQLSADKKYPMNIDRTSGIGTISFTNKKNRNLYEEVYNLEMGK